MSFASVMDPSDLELKAVYVVVALYLALSAAFFAPML